MSDLHALLPDFATERHAALIAGLETHRIGLSEVLTLDAAEIGRRTRLPLLDLQLFARAVRARLREEGGVRGRLSVAPAVAVPVPLRISTLDPRLDAVLGGGFVPGQLSEVVGESGAGKTQLLLGLLLAVQLPPPQGLGRRALYIATEAPLPTGRLAQMVRAGRLGAPAVQAGGSGAAGSADTARHAAGPPPLPPPAATPTAFLANIATINTPDLEAQDHILTHQLPVQLATAAAAGNGFGLVVLDSVAANFRPHYGRGGAESLAARSLALTRLGMLLRALAHQHQLAVVVANQVADRFARDGERVYPQAKRPRQTPAPSQAARRSPSRSQPTPPLRRDHTLPALPTLPASQPPQPPQSPPLPQSPPPPPQTQMPSQMLSMPSQFPLQFLAPPPPVLQLDHQQLWFTGWGDDMPPTGRSRGPSIIAPKTPALGLVWATQLSTRVALVKAPRPAAAAESWVDDTPDARTGVVGAPRLRQSWQRWLKVVFAPHAAPGMVEFAITTAGLRATDQDT